jgi:hypothetical protein
MSSKRTPCPKCQSKKIVPIQYGKPTMATLDKSEAGKLVLGGCCVNEESAKWYCLDCEHEFGQYWDPLKDLKLPDLGRVRPLTLEFSIGGFFAENHRVKLENGQLMYQYCDAPLSWDQIDAKQILPTVEQWIDFKKALNSINAWEWAPKYFTPDVCDGTQWELKINYGNKRINSYGSNAYPGTKDDDMIFNLSRTPEFTAFVDALGLLLGGVDI